MMRPFYQHQRRCTFNEHRVGNRRGMVLIIVMIVIVMVSLAGFSFAALMFTERKAVVLHGDELQLANAVDSAEEFIKSYLKSPAQASEVATNPVADAELFRAVALEAEADLTRDIRFSVVSPLVIDEEIAGLKFGLEDESGRLNLAVLPDWEKKEPGSARLALMNLPGMTETAADSILDWIDSDSEPRSLGAEDEHYMGLSPPYRPRNAAPESIEELLLIKDVTRELLFGADADRNFRIDEHEQQPIAIGRASARMETTRSWESYLTVFSAEGNIGPQGRPRVNLNDDNLPRLHQALSQLFGPEWSQFIIAIRQYGLHSGSDSKSSSGGLTLDLSRPAKFRIDSIFDLIGAQVAIPSKASNEGPQVVAGPFRDDRESMRTYLPKLLDATAVSSGPATRGRININRAPPAVLAGVPGIDDALAEQIASARDANAGQSQPATRNAAWLLTDGLVDVAKMKSLAAYINGGGDVYRAQIVGFIAGRERSPAARVELIIDATTAEPRRLYRQDLRMLGRGFSLAELGAGPDLDSTTGRTASADRPGPVRKSALSEQR